MVYAVQKLFTFGSHGYLKNCAPIKDQFVEFQNTLLGKGYTPLMDTPTYHSIIRFNLVGLEPVTAYKFGAVAIKDSPLLEDISTQSQRDKEQTIKEHISQINADMPGTVIMELDTLSGRAINYADGEGKGKEGVADLVATALFPDTGFGSENRTFMDGIPEGTKFIQGVKATYYAGLQGHLMECNLYLEQMESAQKYSEEEVQKLVPDGHVYSMVNAPEGLQDVIVHLRGSTAEETHNSLDTAIKALHNVEGVRYLPFLVEDGIDPLRVEDSRTLEIMFANNWVDFTSDDKVIEAIEARKKGEVNTLKDLGVNLILEFDQQHLA